MYQDEEPEMVLEPQILSSLKISKIFKDHQKEINAIDFSRDGQFLVSCDDTILSVYDVLSGKKVRTLYNKVHEIDLVKFTNHNTAVLCVTRKEPYEIYYWSLHENEILKKFKGHEDAIYWLDYCPTNEMFLTCSRDMTLRLWNLNSMSQQCEAILDLKSKKTHPVGAFDEAGCIFAVVYHQDYGVEFNKLLMYDLNNYQERSFLSTQIKCPRICLLKFSQDGRNLLCGTRENTILILDAFDGKQKIEINDYNNENSFIEASFTPDSKYVISGSESGHIHIWNVENGQQIVKLEGHQTKSKCVKFSPRFALMASGGLNLVLWTPWMPQKEKNIMSI